MLLELGAWSCLDGSDSSMHSSPPFPSRSPKKWAWNERRPQPPSRSVIVGRRTCRPFLLSFWSSGAKGQWFATHPIAMALPQQWLSSSEALRSGLVRMPGILTFSMLAITDWAYPTPRDSWKLESSLPGCCQHRAYGEKAMSSTWMAV